MIYKYNIGEVVVTEYRGNCHPVIIKSRLLMHNNIRYNVAFSEEGSSFVVNEDEITPYRKDKLDLI